MTSNGCAKDFRLNNRQYFVEWGGYFTFIEKAIAMMITKRITLMYLLITTTPFREWHNRRPPFFEKGEAKEPETENNFKFRMKSRPAGIFPGKDYYISKHRTSQYVFAAVSDFSQKSP